MRFLWSLFLSLICNKPAVALRCWRSVTFTTPWLPRPRMGLTIAGKPMPCSLSKLSSNCSIACSGQQRRGIFTIWVLRKDWSFTAFSRVCLRRSYSPPWLISSSRGWATWISHWSPMIMRIWAALSLISLLMARCRRLYTIWLVKHITIFSLFQQCLYRLIHTQFQPGVDPNSVKTDEEKKTPGPAKCLALLYRGCNAIEIIRSKLGVTDPKKARAGTIR